MLAMDQLRRADVTRAYQDQQYVIRRQALSELLTLWPIWDLSRLDETWEPFETALLSVIERYHRMSTGHAGRYYSTLRLVQGIEGETPIHRSEFDRERWQANLRLLGPIFTKKQILNRRPNPKDVALVRLSGVVTAGVLDGGRDTLLRTGVADTRSAGWRRVTEGTCAWCRQLAAWGAFHRNGPGWKGHTNCRCVVEPQWDGQADTPPIDMAQLQPKRFGNPDITFNQMSGDKAQYERFEDFSDAYKTRHGMLSGSSREFAEKSAERIGAKLDGRVDADKLLDCELAIRTWSSTNFDTYTPGQNLYYAVVDNWAVSSGDSSVKNLLVQRAAAERYGLPWPPSGYQVLANRDSYLAEALARTDELYQVHREAMDAVLDEMYQEGQRVLDDLYPGTDTITLSRGFNDNLKRTEAGEFINEGSHTGLVPGAAATEGQIALNPLSSFTNFDATGKGFGNVYMVTEVPKSRIMSTGFNGMGTISENEFVVIGSAVEDPVTWAMRGSYGG